MAIISLLFVTPYPSFKVILYVIVNRLINRTHFFVRFESLFCHYKLTITNYFILFLHCLLLLLFIWNVFQITCDTEISCSLEHFLREMVVQSLYLPCVMNSLNAFIDLRIRLYPFLSCLNTCFRFLFVLDFGINHSRYSCCSHYSVFTCLSNS